jgi:hypothetical protein
MGDMTGDQPFLLSTSPPARRQERLAVGVVVLLIAALLATAPLARVPLPSTEGLLAAYAAAVLVIELVTAAMLLALFTVHPTRAVLALAAGYLLSGLLVVPWALTFPGILEALDLTPSAHWPEPLVARNVEPDRGPVMVTVDYRIAPEQAPAFLAVMANLADERRRNGAYAWGLLENAAEPGHYLESFTEQSWLGHLHHHERVTEAERALQAAIRDLQIGALDPVVTHFLPPDTAPAGGVA